jgi:hypothetical protein
MVGLNENGGNSMKSVNVQTTSRRLAQSFAILSILIVLAGFILGISLGAELVLSETTVMAIIYSVLAFLILSRDPRHTVGWLFLIVGFLSGIALPYDEESLATFERFYTLGKWFGEMLWIPVFLVPITLVLQFFPDGRLPSRRWWPVTAISILALLGLMTYFAFYPWELEGIYITNNPFGIEGQEGLFNLLNRITQILLGIGIVGSLVMVVARFRKAKGIQRAQMKWLVYTALLGISLMLGFSSFGTDNPISSFLFVSLPIFLAIAISIAILQYRLFDIDLIIRRTLQYALLTGLLALVYFGSVVLLQGLVDNLTGQQSPIVIVISTLVIAALFSPLRIRVQDFIDRRFYRNKYDAEQTLVRFAEVARDEVDIDKLTAAMFVVVEETIQPENKSLWLVSMRTEETR